ncbi:MAG: nuclear transport factor 2 family protein [Deltaproteobacteria bacterium]|nr:nuclear transport factor 2 family protein [Deltaproteobacteria bacterium]
MSNTEVVKTFYEMTDRGNMDAVMALMSPDILWTEMAGFPYGGTYRGKEAVMSGVFARLGSDWDDFSVTRDAFYDAGDTVVISGNYSGVYKKTGKGFNARFTHIWKLKDGKIIKMEQFVDTLLVDRAVNPQN